MRCMNLKMSSCCTLICRPTRSPVASRASLSAAIVVSVSSNDTNMIIVNMPFATVAHVVDVGVLLGHGGGHAGQEAVAVGAERCDDDRCAHGGRSLGASGRRQADSIL